MNLSPSAVVQTLAPWVLAGAAVTLALVLAVLVALFAPPYFLLRLRRHREEGAGAGDGAGDSPEAGGIGGFTWASEPDEDGDGNRDEDRRAG
ncbi:hypothetical protein [Streptomyces sp. TBY4]|uniref:hypothetical protein n=1 Tax=Streptomyces sp. TBY4 TaxID=2962030 RepID=UPI0020B70E36|nr:hypothetical protein [Streptomyces sp. TBY4]MCP3753833.1 hypothetical protein [Streptomyces sp. TBY4]